MLSLNRLRWATALLCLAPCAWGFDGELKIDNAAVRITEIAEVAESTREIQPSSTNRLFVSIGPGDVEITQDGHIQRQHWVSGQVILVAGSQRLVWKNVGPSPIQLVEIELKAVAAEERQGRNPQLDPVVIDPRHNIPVLENNQVRVFRSWREPGATEMMHEHVGIGRAAILLTSLDSTVKLGDGSVVVSRAAQGDVLWSGPVVHATTNLSSQRFEMVIVEVK